MHRIVYSTVLYTYVTLRLELQPLDLFGSKVDAQAEHLPHFGPGQPPDQRAGPVGPHIVHVRGLWATAASAALSAVALALPSPSPAS